MSRSIVLRFDAVCFDCGAALPAGSTARWFGRGRVSCCGAGAPGAGAAPAPVSTPAPAPRAPRALPPRGVPVPLSSLLPPSASDRARSFVDDTQAAITRAQAAALPPELARALQCGMQANHVAELARIAPSTRLCVRLDSGARFVVTAEHAAHVLACIVESCRDRIRDVMGAAS